MKISPTDELLNNVERTHAVHIPRGHPDRHKWDVGRLTELMLEGHSWKSVRQVLMLSKPEFDQLLEDAIEQARLEEQWACERYLKELGRGRA